MADDPTATAEAPAEEAPKKGRSSTSDKFDLVNRFLELSGYEKSDVWGHNEERRTVTTSNGGKYEVSVKGRRLRTLAGPPTPAERDAEQEDDDE